MKAVLFDRLNAACSALVAGDRGLTAGVVFGVKGLGGVFSIAFGASLQVGALGMVYLSPDGEMALYIAVGQ